MSGNGAVRERHKVVIVGGGFGGMQAAHMLVIQAASRADEHFV